MKMNKDEKSLINNIKDIILHLDKRHIGNTTSMLNGAFLTNSLVLFQTVIDGKVHNVNPKNILTLNDLNQLKGSTKPLLIDHHLCSNILKQTLEIIDKQAFEIKKLTPKDKVPNIFGSDRKILVSRIKTPDGTILTSHYTHDFVTHIDKNGLTYMLDGGSEYQRTIINADAPHEDISIYEDDPFEEIRKYYCGLSNVRIKPIPLFKISKNALTKHIENMFNDEILNRNNSLSKKFGIFAMKEYLYRETNKINK